MPVTLSKFKKPSETAAKPAEKPAESAAPTTPAPATKPAQAAPKAPVKGVSFLHKGGSAKSMIEDAEAKAQAAMDAAGKPWRFRIDGKKLGQEFPITFVDGNLNDEGMIDCPVFYEHTLFMAGKWQNIICLESAQEEPCPLCEVGHGPYLACAMTIIDHSEYKRKDGSVAKDQKKLLIAKRTSLKVLQKIATKRGGLAGCRFEVTRTTEKEPNIGNMFEFVEKTDIKTLIEKFGKTKEGEVIFRPFDYGEVLDYMDRKTLIEKGYTKASAGGGDGGATADEL
jgi:hypothetical protein